MKIGILGGGISGLAVAHFLDGSDPDVDAPGPEVVVLEAETRAGGVIRTVHSGGDVSAETSGIPLDVGPQRTRVTPDVRELVERAGLADDLIEAPEDDLPLFVYRNGRLREVPFTMAAALRTDLLGWAEKLRVLAEPFTAGPRLDETVERFFTRKFGAGAYRAMIGPLYGGLYASDPGRMYARHGLSMTIEHFGVQGSLLLALMRRGTAARTALPTVSFTRGMQMLPDALARALGARVRTGCRVMAVRPSRPTGPGPEATPPSSAPRFRIEVEGSDALDVDRVIVALPSRDAARVLAPLAPDAARRIGRLRYNRLAVVHVWAKGQGGPETHSLRGLGYQVAFGESLETRGVTFNGAMFDRGGLCTVYLGGMRNPDLVDWPDERIARVALGEFTEVTGRRAELLNVARTWIPAWDETWDAIAGLELPDGVHLCTNWNARPGIPGRATMARRVAEALVGSPRT